MMGYAMKEKLTYTFTTYRSMFQKVFFWGTTAQTKVSSRGGVEPSLLYLTEIEACYNNGSEPSFQLYDTD